MKRLILTIFLLLVTSSLAAQLVDMPDATLRVAVRQTLNMPDTAPLTQAAMARLTRLDVTGMPIEHLVGLEYADQSARSVCRRLQYCRYHTT